MSFGSYDQAIYETIPTNTTTPRTLDIIYLQSLDTFQGRSEDMDLLTGKTILLQSYSNSNHSRSY